MATPNQLQQSPLLRINAACEIAIATIAPRADISGTVLQTYLETLGNFRELTFPDQQTIVDGVAVSLQTSAQEVYSQTIIGSDKVKQIFAIGSPPIVQGEQLEAPITTRQRFRRDSEISDQHTADEFYAELRDQELAALTIDLGTAAQEAHIAYIDEELIQKVYEDMLDELAEVIEVSARIADTTIVPLHRGLLTRRVKEWGRTSKQDTTNMNRIIGNLDRDLQKLTANPEQYVIEYILSLYKGHYDTQAADEAEEVIEGLLVTHLNALDEKLRQAAAELSELSDTAGSTSVNEETSTDNNSIKAAGKKS